MAAALFHKLEGHHSVQATNIADGNGCVGAVDGLKTGCHGGPNLVGACAEVFFLNHIQHCKRGRAGDGAAGVGAAQVPSLWRIND